MTKHTLSVDDPESFDRFRADLDSELLRSRTLIVGPTLNEKNYNLVIAQLLFLQQQDPIQEISLWINYDHPSEISPLAICDVVGSLACDVRTYFVGKAIELMAVLLHSGNNGKES